MAAEAAEAMARRSDARLRRVAMAGVGALGLRPLQPRWEDLGERGARV